MAHIQPQTPLALLFGIAQTAPVGVGTSSEINTTGAGFGDLFGLLIATKDILPTENEFSYNVRVLEHVTTEPESDEFASLEATASPELISSTLSINPFSLIGLQNGFPQQTRAKTETVLSQAVIEDASDISGTMTSGSGRELSNALPNAQTLLNDLSAHSPFSMQVANLEKGDYKITDTQISVNRVRMNVNSESANHDFTISAPLEVADPMGKAVDHQNLTASIANVQSGSQLFDSPHINSLLSSVKLQAIDIQPVETEMNETGSPELSSHVVTSKITNENPLQVVVKKLEKSSSIIVNNPSKELANETLSGETETDPNTSSENIRNESPLLNNSSTGLARAFEQDLFTHEPVMNGSTLTDSNRLNTFQLSSSEHISGNTERIDTKVFLTQARVTLPENAAASLKTQGQSILLHIEPEYLGPAKLHLSIRNEQLTARVTVDSVQAKAVLENSLDQLSSQLHKAGIAVDYLEVNLRNGDSGGQFFNRQHEQASAHFQTMSRLRRNYQETANVIPHSSTGQSRDIAYGYINSTGINLVA
ncbi:MAG: flagellar hook-length control protein FliK [candidate division Zixibacteria bacterium]|nr:flagellar hook-length control protein FliK [candidate division Zixibacteria bacterium]